MLLESRKRILIELCGNSYHVRRESRLLVRLCLFLSRCCRTTEKSAVHTTGQRRSVFLDRLEACWGDVILSRFSAAKCQHAELRLPPADQPGDDDFLAVELLEMILAGEVGNDYLLARYLRGVDSKLDVIDNAVHIGGRLVDMFWSADL